MKECVLVPTYKRPDLLSVCLEAIRKADPTIEIHVFPDRGTGAEELAVTEKFNAVLHTTEPHYYHGNTRNMLEMLKWAYYKKYDLVFVVEDDCIIDETFFNWAREALSDPPFGEQPFAACGWLYTPNAPQVDGPNLLAPWYLSVCCAIPRHNLEKIIYHAKPEYYSNLKLYLDGAYPESPRRGSMHYEQDGLVLRVAEAEGKRFVWPRVARSKHIGWHGYHMPFGKKAEGSLDEQVEVVKMAVADPQILRDLMRGGLPPAIEKCAVCKKILFSQNKDANHVCVDCFHREYPTLPKCAKTHYYMKPISV